MDCPMVRPQKVLELYQARAPETKAPPVLVSVIVPTHNEASNVEILHQRLQAVFDGMPSFTWELVFCDDSTDQTPDIITAMNKADQRVKLIRLTRSFGQSIAIAAGLKRAAGACAIIMDADLQDPPEAIPQLLAKWQAGAKVVYVERASEARSLVYKTLAMAFYRMLSRISSVPIPVDAGEFRLLDRRVIDFMNGLRERSRFIRGLTVWPGFAVAKIQIVRSERLSGVTNYNLRRSFSVALDGIVSFSVLPLRFAMIAGFLASTGALVLSLGYLAVWLVDRDFFTAGWPSIFLGIMFFGGANLFCLGVIGEYVGRIFLELQARPLYLVDREVGFE